MSDRIKILAVDDHLIVRRGLATLLIARNGMQVVGEAASGEEAVAKARTLRPDVILMDLYMPRMGGIEAIGLIRADNPNARILVLSNYDEDDHIRAAIQAGARGYLSKDTSPDELLTAIRKLASGGTYLSQEITQKLVSGFQTPPPTPQTPSTPSMELTERELEVLAELAKGRSNAQIAKHLVLNQTTVRSHVSSILDKLGVANRTEAAVYARQFSILSNRSEPDNQ